MSAPREIRVLCHPPFCGPAGQGLLADDARVRTLRKVLVTYPEVRHIVPDRISLEPAVEAKTLDIVVRFLERQVWLVKSVLLE